MAEITAMHEDDVDLVEVAANAGRLRSEMGIGRARLDRVDLKLDLIAVLIDQLVSAAGA